MPRPEDALAETEEKSSATDAAHELEAQPTDSTLEASPNAVEELASEADVDSLAEDAAQAPEGPPGVKESSPSDSPPLVSEANAEAPSSESQETVKPEEAESQTLDDAGESRILPRS